MPSELTFHIQDPRDRGGNVLTFELSKAFADLGFLEFRGMFAFASVAGVKAAFETPEFQGFLARGGHASVVVGVDAVTDEAALNELLRLQGPTFDVEVYQTLAAGTIFHPKFSLFSGPTKSLMVLGSGNLTVGGLQRNYEAFLSHPSGDSATCAQWLGEWTSFRSRNGDSIGPVDERALARARLNQRVKTAARKAALEELEGDSVSLVQGDDEPLVTFSGLLGGDRRVLVATVPRARWGQVQFDISTMQTYFGLVPGSDLQISLQGVDEFGGSQAVEVRRLVYSAANGNAKVEFSTRRSLSYPDAGRPILVVREDATRFYTYSLFVPGDPEYEQLSQWIEKYRPMNGGMRRPQIRWEDLVSGSDLAAQRIADVSP